MRYPLILAFLLALTGTAVKAQETPEPLDGPASVTVEIDGYDFAIDAAQVFTACVVDRHETLDATTVTLRVVVKSVPGKPDAPPMEVLPPRVLPAEGVLADAHAYDCFALAVEPEGN